MRLCDVLAASAMQCGPSWSLKYGGPVVASTASERLRQARVAAGAPLNMVGRPVAPIQRSPEIGWSMIPIKGQPSCSSAISVPKIGRPAMKLTVPSRSEEHTSELQSLIRISYAVFCLKKKKTHKVKQMKPHK